jgi:hypothetical protein
MHLSCFSYLQRLNFAILFIFFLFYFDKKLEAGGRRFHKKENKNLGQRERAQEMEKMWCGENVA